MKKVKIGVIGLGGMGTTHARSIVDGKIKNAELVAVCDLLPEKIAGFDDNIKKFTNSAKLLRSGIAEAVIVATPHYDHTTIGIDALNNGIHLLVEKPISVHKADCELLIAAAEKNKQLKFAAMFNQRTDPHYRKIYDLIKRGELGELTRVNWIITNWFRTQHYYNSGGWRATWKGEGGGVLLNQCPHNLDLLQWICGMPSKVRAFCQLGKWHDIEVEDQVTAYLEYANGATGVFIATTGEAPGTNRLEICGEYGKIVVEHGNVSFVRNLESMFAYSKTAKSSFTTPDIWNIEIPTSNNGSQHNGIIQNFVDAISSGAELIAPAEEGINSVELGNAMLLSSALNKTIDLPMDSKVFADLLNTWISESRYQKSSHKDKGTVEDLSATFNIGGR